MDNTEWIKNNSFLRTNTSIEAFKSLEKLSETLSLIEDDIYQWKWAIIFIHNSMQAFMTLALESTYRVNVIRHKEKKTGEITIYLLEFEELYKRIKKDKYMKQVVNSKTFAPTEEQNKAIKDLCSFRNDFVHYVPKFWSIQLLRFPEMFLSVMSIIEFLIFESGNFLYKYEQEEADIINKYIGEIYTKLEGLQNG